jgi:hypothetical protein
MPSATLLSRIPAWLLEHHSMTADQFSEYLRARIKTWDLLDESNAKTSKGLKRGYLTQILYLAPADLSGMNVCACSSDGCRRACLTNSGHGAFGPTQIKRATKTWALLLHRREFVDRLARLIVNANQRARRARMGHAVRLNGTSDLPRLVDAVMAHPDIARLVDRGRIQFYDYTKIPEPWKRARAGYHLTFSLSENNRLAADQALAHGINVAVAFDARNGTADRLPTTWEGYQVISGDDTDLRFLDSSSPAGFIVGLRIKRTKDRDTGRMIWHDHESSNGFVQISGAREMRIAA